MIAQRIQRIPRRLVADTRGSFIKCIDGKESGLPSYTGEVYMVEALSGQSRGNHYHHSASEWFTVVSGSGILALQDIQTGECLEIELAASAPETIMVPPGLAHVFVNAVQAIEPLVVIAYTDKLYDPADTISHIVR